MENDHICKKMLTNLRNHLKLEKVLGDLCLVWDEGDSKEILSSIKL